MLRLTGQGDSMQAQEVFRLPFTVFGKTGTFTSSNGFRSQGWFVGFSSDVAGDRVPTPAQVKFGVLFLELGHLLV